ncbi:diguanylate cyclase [Zoogloea sp.]|uniref:diguanylate cyclase domain-containing protein n=1 Tax=Zoogloea sp. TaxID=49181 RepID=UPI00261D8D70|nr:diguanylate cyclase [Zoogloea sp.]
MKPVRHPPAQRDPATPGWSWLHRLAACMALLWLTVAVAPGAAVADTRSETVYQVGITAFRDKAVTTREWQPTMDFLSSKIPGSRFVARPMNLGEFQLALGRKELDFVLTNPEHYIIMESLYGVSRLATLVKSADGKLVNQFGGVIFTRSDRPDINRLEDLRGKHVAAVDHTSFAAFLLQYDLLKQHNVNLDTEAKVRFLGFPQDLCVNAVLDGKADAGFVRTGVLEAMSAEGKIDISRLRIINPTRSHDFPFLISTGLFPEWPLAAAPHVQIDIANQVAAALLLMPPDSPAARAARYYRWSTPLEYQSVQNIMRRHRIYPYDKPEAISLTLIFQQYLAQILSGLLLAFAALSTLYIRTRRLNIDLKASRRQLHEMAHHDALTGLPNRNLLDDRLTLALAQARRSGNRVALCLIDLDGFKPINDHLGHKAGDEVLQEVARRLEDSLREGDTVARWGGDEFVLLLNGFTETGQLEDIMNRVLQAVADSFRAGNGMKLSASIGVSIYPADAGDSFKLFKHADDAMYRAKKRGGNCFIIHSGDIQGQPAASA